MCGVLLKGPVVAMAFLSLVCLEFSFQQFVSQEMKILAISTKRTTDAILEALVNVVILTRS